MKKTLLTYIKVFFILQFLFVLFGIISCLLPNTPVRKNIEQSVKIYHSEPLYPKHFIDYPAFQSDNFTDYLIMNLIYNYSPDKPLKYMLMPQGHVTFEESGIGAENLKYSIENQSKDPDFTYGRYWHGSTFAYRMLFLITDLSGVRWLNFLLCSMVVFAFVYRIGNAVTKPEMYSLLLGMVFVNYYIVFTSFQFTPVYLIALTGSMVLVKKAKNHKRVDVLFMILGALTCYFDLLTAPALTLGIPMLVWILVQPDILDLPGKIKKVLGYSFLWAIGYVATWVFKWVLIFLFSNHSIVDEIKMKVDERAGTWRGTRMDAIVENISMLNLVVLNICLSVFLLLTILFFNKKGIKKAALFLMIAFIPFVWYFSFANHSELHNWFTYRLLWVSVSGIFLMFTSLIRWENIKFFPARKKQG